MEGFRNSDFYTSERNVAVVSIDEIFISFPDNTIVSVIKIDVEGGELDVLLLLQL